MATVLYDLEVTIASAELPTGIRPDEKSVLFRKVDAVQTKPKEAGAIVRAQVVEEPVEEDLSFEELDEGYSELIQRTKNILRTIADRGSNLVYSFNPMQNPMLAEAISAIFKGEFSRITMDMYLAALVLEKDLSVAVGEAQVGTSR